MSTNYYIKLPAVPVICAHCGGKSPEVQEIHIGKYSAGWKFGFNRRLKTFADWKVMIHACGSCIYDEYDRRVDPADLLEIIKASHDGIWLFDPRCTDPVPSGTPSDYEFLDAKGYRFINAESFC